MYLIESIMNMPVPFNMIVLIVLIGCMTGVLTTIAQETRKFFCHREEMELKREMLERGMNADEINQVLRATTGHQPRSKVHC